MRLAHVKSMVDRKVEGKKTRPSPINGEPTDKAQEISRLKSVGWWLMLLICIAYAGFAFDMFRIELVSFLTNSPIEEARSRKTPVAFQLHAVLGGIGLICGALQFNRTILRKYKYVHRGIGWVYLVAIWGASLTGIYNSIYFDVPVSARGVFAVVGVWWFLTTSMAFWQIRKRDVQRHQGWMIRSFAISLFFVTFPVWVPSLQWFTPDAIAWPAGLFCAVVLNMTVGECWINHAQR